MGFNDAIQSLQINTDVHAQEQQRFKHTHTKTEAGAHLGLLDFLQLEGVLLVLLMKVVLIPRRVVVTEALSSYRGAEDGARGLLSAQELRPCACKTHDCLRVEGQGRVMKDCESEKVHARREGDKQR